MKKLALALVCLVSVAFFASCDPEENIQEVQPSIEILTEDGYLQNGDVLDLNELGLYGFRAASNVNTQAKLAKFVVTCAVTSGDETEEPSVIYDTLIDGTEFVFEDYIYFEIEGKDLIGSAEVTATVTDVDGYSNSTSFKIDINKEEALEVTSIEWTKWGHTVEDLSAYGLEMQANNWKSPFVHIYPAEGCALYVIENDSEDWFEAVETASNLAGLFQMLYEDPEVPACTDYNKIDCNASARYDDVLVTKDAEGNYHAIHITGTSVAVEAPNGTKIIISGEAK